MGSCEGEISSRALCYSNPSYCCLSLLTLNWRVLFERERERKERDVTFEIGDYLLDYKKVTYSNLLTPSSPSFFFFLATARQECRHRPLDPAHAQLTSSLR